MYLRMRSAGILPQLPAPAMKADRILVDFENVPHPPRDRIGKDRAVFTAHLRKAAP